MSKEYRNRYLQKVMGDTSEAMKNGMPVAFVPKFIKRRMLHYGIYCKYLPPDFKIDQPTITNNVSTETPSIERVETSNS